MRKLIFLDIDGVLNGIEFLGTRNGYINKKCIELLNQLQGAEIVVSSSWGYDNGRTEKTLLECGLRIPIVGYTEHFHVDWMCRGNEIEKWLVTNFPNSCLGTRFGPKYVTEYKYVIFDDDCDFLLGQKDNFIRTNERTGLSQEDVNKAKLILDV